MFQDHWSVLTLRTLAARGAQVQRSQSSTPAFFPFTNF
jgi:hypothetical protein